MTINKRDKTKGDAFDLQVVLDTNVTDWEIRCEIWDNQTVPISLRKANNKVTGGSSGQVEMTDPANGTFVIHVDALETTGMKGDIKIEVEVTDLTGDNTTVVKDFIVLSEERIQWINV